MREKSTVRLRKNGVSRTWKSLRGEGGGRRQVLVGEGGGGMNVIDKGRKEKEISLSAKKIAFAAPYTRCLSYKVQAPHLTFLLAAEADRNSQKSVSQYFPEATNFITAILYAICVVYLCL